MMFLLFDAKRRYLGEVLTEEEKILQRVTLSQDGEKEIGALVKLWQTKGVPIRKEIESKDAEGKKRQLVFYKEYVPTRTKKFEQALKMWASDYGVSLVVLEERLLSYWQMLVRLPLEPSELFAYLVILRQTPEGALPEWKQGLEEAISLVQHDRTDSRQHVHALQKRMTQKHANPFTKHE